MEPIEMVSDSCAIPISLESTPSPLSSKAEYPVSPTSSISIEFSPRISSSPTTTTIGTPTPPSPALTYTPMPTASIPTDSYPIPSSPSIEEKGTFYEPNPIRKERLSTALTSATASPIPRPFRPPSRPNSSISIPRRNRSASTVSSSALASPQIPDGFFAAVSPVILLSSPRLESTKSKINPVIVRDFAFPREDPRFNGSDSAEQAKNRMSSSTNLDDELGNEAFASSGSSAFSWGFVTSHETDFPAEDDGQQYSEEEELDPDQQEFVRGIYEAMFDFEPELETEMLLKAGDIVSVVARKCAGWVQAGKVKDSVLTGEIGLVPENYLMLLERDEDEWSEGEEELENETLEGEEGDQPATPKASGDSPS